MKRFLSAVFLCLSLLVTVSFIIVHRTTAKDDLILEMLNLPAPPPPNPWMPVTRRDEKFYSKAAPPADDAPIEDLLDYWARQSRDWTALRYKPVPTERTLDRILGEVERDNSLVFAYLNIFRNSERAGEVIRRIDDSRSLADTESEGGGSLRDWLKNYTSSFSNELERDARSVRDANEYVTNQSDLLNLTRVDWERARPIVDEMYRNNSAPVSQVLAKWALYKHALATDSIDVGRYRDELIAVVEDTKATNGMRDLAFDALVSEREWAGRDEWYYKLMEDETLADLRVNGSSYTGLTTLIMYSPEDKYVDKMIELLGSENQTVRNAAARNLLVVMSPERPQITRALLPWIADPKWVKLPDERGREMLVNSLGSVKIPESVPVLIAALDQRVMREMHLPVVPSSANAAARAAMAANMAANAMAAAANAVRSSGGMTYSQEDVYVTTSNLAANAANTSYRTVSMASFPLRRPAITALGFQGDMRAAPALRRMLTVVEDYEKGSVVKALIACNGFTADEQVNALETMIREVDANPSPSAFANTAMNTNARAFNYYHSNKTSTLIGSTLMETRIVSDELVNAVSARIASLEKREPDIADVMRRIMAQWDGSAVDALLLRDLKNGKGEAIVKLLARRKEIVEKVPSAVFELRSGTAAAVGFSTCFLDSETEYNAVLSGENNETKAAMLACARLVRGKVPVGSVIPLLQSPDKRLALAAEKYLESEDSPQARAAVLARYPGEAKILGATTAFGGAGASEDSNFLLHLFASVNDYFAGRSYFYHEPQETALEKELQDEVKATPDLLGIYAYDLSFIRIYKDRAAFSWEEDEARYRERTLEPAEFEAFKAYLAQNRVDELPPFLGCREDARCGEAIELLMLGRNGGRRIYLMSSRTPPFFAGLESMIADMKRPSARLRYWLERSVPGLEILFADENLSAETVWKNGAELRILVNDSKRQEAGAKRAEEEIESLGEEGGEDTREAAMRAYKIRDAHSYDGYAWFAFSAAGLVSAEQPGDVDFLIPRDGISPPAAFGAWKSRAAGFEVRADETGLYKISGGRAVKVRSGQYAGPVVTPDGRWAVASSYVEGEGAKVVRIDLLSGKEHELAPEVSYATPIAFVPAVDRILLKYPGDRHYEDEEDITNADGAWLDPETGRITPASGELRPLMQQTFRKLQAASSGDFWAAIPEPAKAATVVGIYSARTMKFTPRLTLPKIKFDSMKMWVDETEGRVYITYEGHLISVPLAASAGTRGLPKP